MDPMQLPVKLSRGRMILDFADGSARHFEASEPVEAEIKLLTVDDLMEERYGYRLDPPFFAADYLTSLMPSYGDRFGGVILRLACQPRGIKPAAQLRIEQDSGEIPPELASRAVDIIDTMRWPESVLLKLRPYLARIAGRQP
jgi:hypothetical protein